ncbi:MAG: asparaginase [Planctomycetes bacterium]|nr:asparaginase [Planctomycetota bacterium]MCW8136821.1 asparaginase [Planctomycetota bacterium]
MTRLQLIFTGGTISMRDTPQGAVPVLSGDELLRDVPGLERFCQVDVHDFGQLPGPHMTPARMWELSKQVQAALATHDGVVITHGTDTLEETAGLLDLRHTGDKPVVLVGAMRTSSQLSWDGPINLYQGCRVAADPRAIGRGVIVVMNSTVFAASEVTKTYTDALDTFQSPDVGPLGMFDGDDLRLHRMPAARKSLVGERLETRVGLVVASAGDDGGLIDHCVARGDKGLVIEAMGRGNLPPPMASAAERALNDGVLVVLTSRCWGGRVSATYGYEGGGARLRDMGLVFAPGVPGHKARIIAMAALGAGMGVPELRAWLS